METKECTKCGNVKELSEFYSYEKETKTKGKYIYYQPYCKDCTIQKSRKQHQDNRDYRNEKNKQWRENNKEHVLDYAKNYRLEHLESFNKSKKQWRQSNPEKMSEYNRNYTNKKKHNFTTKQWNDCKDYFDNSCAYCGISEQDAKEKYNKGLHREHAMNDGNNDISNCIPACTGCNSTKRKKDYIEWYTPDNEIFDQDRFNKILKWLNDDFKLYI